LWAQEQDFATARQHLTAGEELLRKVNDPLSLANLLCSRGQVELLAENPTAAAASFTEAESIAAELNLLPASALAQSIAALRAALASTGH